MSDSERRDTTEQQRPVDTTSATPTDDAAEADVGDDGGGVFIPTRSDGELVAVERETDVFPRRDSVRVKPTNKSLFDQHIRGHDNIDDLTDEEWASYFKAILVDPDPYAAAKSNGKASVNAAFIRENTGRDQRREIAALSLEAGGYSDAAANARGEMTDQQKENLEVMLKSGEVDMDDLAEQAREAETQ